MIETFSIKEEEFINEIYFVNLGVSFNKKKSLTFLKKKYFSTIPLNKKVLFIPIIIDEKEKRFINIFK